MQPEMKIISIFDGVRWTHFNFCTGIHDLMPLSPHPCPLPRKGEGGPFAALHKIEHTIFNWTACDSPSPLGRGQGEGEGALDLLSRTNNEMLAGPREPPMRTLSSVDRAVAFFINAVNLT